MVLNDEKIITWSDFKKGDGEATFGLLSQVSPDGRYVISTVKDRAVFVATPDIWYSQLFFPIKGILVVYDTKTGTFKALPGADDPEYVQSNPTWSRDGKSIVFARTKAYKKDVVANATSVLLSEKDVPEFVNDKEPFKFDLYRVPFNDGRGGKAEPIEGASHNGKSNYFAKFSPDGKWIIFCKAENYMLLMPDSELYIIPAEGGEARRLRANTPRMNSWHSWSSNGRWLVFSSKANTAYTQLFLTHIDENGESTPPVVLERFTGSRPRRQHPGVRSAARRRDREDQGAVPRRLLVPARGHGQRTDRQLPRRRQGLRARPRRRARERRTPELPRVRVVPAGQEQGGGRRAGEGARGRTRSTGSRTTTWPSPRSTSANSRWPKPTIRESLAIKPQPAIYNDLGFVLERQGLPDEAAEAYRKALKLDPESASAHYNLGASLARSGKFAEAESHLRAALKTSPNTQAYTGLGVVLLQLGRTDEAIASLQAAIKADPKNAAARQKLAEILESVNDPGRRPR